MKMTISLFTMYLDCVHLSQHCCILLIELLLVDAPSECVLFVLEVECCVLDVFES
jgi:hypothetical protein